MSLSLVSQTASLIQNQRGQVSFKAVMVFNENLSGTNYAGTGTIGSFGFVDAAGQSHLLDGSLVSRVLISGNTATYTWGLETYSSIDPGWRFSLLFKAGAFIGVDGTTYGPNIGASVSTPFVTITGDSNVNEGSTDNLLLHAIGYSAGTTLNYQISGIDASRLVGNALQGSVTFDSSGNATIPFGVVNNNHTDGSSTATITLINANGASFSVLVNDTSKTPATPISYVITGAPVVNEGVTEYLQIQTTGLASGSVINYTVSGIDASRVSPIGYMQPGGFTPSSPITSLNNYVMVNDSGRATINLQILNNNHTDGPTTAVVSIANGAATYSVLVNDTSLSPTVAPVYTFIGGSSVMNEGQSDGLLLQTTGISAGTSLQYIVSGIEASRLASGSTTGYVTVDSNGQALINLGVVANNHTDGQTTAVVSVANGAANYSILVNDTSLTSTGTNYITITTPNSITNLTSADDQVTGSAGIDTVAFTGTSFEYNVIRGSSFRTLVVENFVGGDSSDVLINVERIKFSDTNLALDIDLWDNAGSAYRLYKAAFDRAPDESGLGYWIDVLDDGGSLQLAASGFINSAEFQSLYGANPSDTLFLTKLYNNVLDRDPDQGGLNYWIGQLNGGMSRESALINFSESNENVSNVAALIENGIEYQPWLL